MFSRVVLITQRMNRRRGTYTNLWVLPGGHVDPGETIRGAAAREALEVSGLRRWMAEAAGVRLIRIVDINANQGGGVQRETLALSSRAVPVLGGELMISASASISWEIGPR